ncbi:aldo/keto reductase [Sphaerotilus uruguayifluvii]|uniref:Aryl-alcohol dehydrogenase-like predicted oxidoreductase n=1 Tax=Sphaerotilus uruguayifluvii TaxID=2735897 RepID=A0ABX2G6D4_9BURK|nr:aldo/keto reductase [Leptothrix sp. C29]NRT57888.1 aryl-alcohol dehydrogenase-like predicted oxidoreductase [Leptothrix sp. C29]
MQSVSLGRSDLRVSPVCLGTMTFGEQVDEAGAFRILDRALELGIDFIDTAEMYAVPPRRETFNATEIILGRWLAARPGVREKLTIATKVAGPSRGMDWIRGGSADLSADDIVAACEGSLRRLGVETIDLYQLHWPTRPVPMFGATYFDPARAAQAQVTPIEVQLRALDRLVREGKVRAIGLSNETPYGVCEFVHLAERHGLARVATVQNAYCLVNRVPDNGLDEAMHQHQVSLLAYSPLGFGLLTGKYDEVGLHDPARQPGRLALFASMKKQRWARPEALEAARAYNALAREHGLTPTELALAFCYRRGSVASTIIGVTSVAQLEENVAAWNVALAPELLERIDALRRRHWDPAV